MTEPTEWKKKRNNKNKKENFVGEQHQKITPNIQHHLFTGAPEILLSSHPTGLIEGYTTDASKIKKDGGLSFDLFLDDEEYYKQCDGFADSKSNKKAQIFFKLVTEVISLLLSPFYKSDKFLYNVLQSMILSKYLEECETSAENKETPTDSKADATGLWIKGMPSLQISNAKAEENEKAMKKRGDDDDDDNDDDDDDDDNDNDDEEKGEKKGEKKEGFTPGPNTSDAYLIDIHQIEDPKKFYNKNKANVDEFQSKNNWITKEDLPRIYQYFQDEYIDFINDENYDFTNSDFTAFITKFSDSLSQDSVIEKIKKSTLRDEWKKMEKQITGPVTSSFNFARKKQLATPEIVETTPPLLPDNSCTTRIEQDPTTVKRIKEDVSIIKNMLYEILLIPVALFVSYSFFNVLFFKKVDIVQGGNNTVNLCEDVKFNDWDETYKYYTNNFSIFIQYIFKPVQLFHYYLMQIKKYEWYTFFENHFPYLAYFLTFVLIYMGFVYVFPEIKNALNIFQISGSNVSGTSILQYICMAIVMFNYVRDLWNTWNDKDNKKEDLNKGGGDSNKGGGNSDVIINTGSTLFQSIPIILYWLLKGASSFFVMGPFSYLILMAYIVSLGIFGIQYNSGTISMNISNINDYIFTSLLQSKDNKGIKDGDLIGLLKTVCKFVFMYIFQIITIVLIILAMTKLQDMNSDHLSSTLMIILGCIIGIICIWSGFNSTSYDENITKKYNENDGSERIIIDNVCPKNEKDTI